MQCKIHTIFPHLYGERMRELSVVTPLFQFPLPMPKPSPTTTCTTHVYCDYFCYYQPLMQCVCSLPMSLSLSEWALRYVPVRIHNAKYTHARFSVYGVGEKASINIKIIIIIMFYALKFYNRYLNSENWYRSQRICIQIRKLCACIHFRYVQSIHTYRTISYFYISFFLFFFALCARAIIFVINSRYGRQTLTALNNIHDFVCILHVDISMQWHIGCHRLIANDKKRKIKKNPAKINIPKKKQTAAY